MYGAHQIRGSKTSVAYFVLEAVPVQPTWPGECRKVCVCVCEGRGGKWLVRRCRFQAHRVVSCSAAWGGTETRGCVAEASMTSWSSFAAQLVPLAVRVLCPQAGFALKPAITPLRPLSLLGSLVAAATPSSVAVALTIMFPWRSLCPLPHRVWHPALVDWPACPLGSSGGTLPCTVGGAVPGVCRPFTIQGPTPA